MIGVYIVETPFAGHEQGERLELDEQQASALSDYIREATVDDLGGEEEVAPDEAPADDAALVQNAVESIKRSNTRAIEKVAASLGKSNKQISMPTVAAQVKQPVFRNMGEMLLSQYKVKTQGNVRERNRLMAYESEMRRKAPPLGANEGTNSQGGYDIKPQWANEIFQRKVDYPRLMDLCNRVPVNSNTYNIPVVSESSLADGQRHGGVLSYWVSEGATLTGSYPAMNQVQAVLLTQATLVYVTNQLLQDANIEAFDSFLKREVGYEIDWQNNIAVTSGAGTTQPVGILNQPSLVTVTKDSNDSSGGMVSFADLSSMYQRMYPLSRGTAVWLLNPELMASLLKMTFPTAASTSTYPAWSLQYDAHEEFPLRIFGRPVIECMNLPAAGAVGDILFADLSQLTVPEHPGIEAAVSDQIQFTTLQTAFRFVRRYDIRSGWVTALTPYDGNSNKSYSPFVALQSRGT